MARILAIDDEKPMRDLVRRVLSEAGHSVTTAGSEREALDRAASLKPDLVICDLVLPNNRMAMDLLRVLGPLPGLEGARYMLVTGRLEAYRLARCFADGRIPIVYMPLNNDEWVSAVRQVLGGPQAPVPEWGIGSFAVRILRNEVRVHGRRVDLNGRPYDLLLGLVIARGEATREHLANAVWPGDPEALREVDRVVHRLRRLLPDPNLIETVRDRGYRIRGTVSACL